MPRRLIAAHEIPELRDADRPDLMERLGMVRGGQAGETNRGDGLSARSEATTGHASSRPSDPSPVHPERPSAIEVACVWWAAFLLTVAAAYGLFQLGRWLGGLLF